jgi:hypothetical protein
MNMRFFLRAALAALIVVGATAPGESQTPVDSALSYADLADLALAAPVAVHVRVRDSVVLERKRAPTVPAYLARFYIRGDVVSLIRGPEMPARIAWVVDLPRDQSGKAPRLRKNTELILLATAQGMGPGELRLVAPDAQLPWTAERAAQLRDILREATAPSAPPRITGIGRAFHVPGALAGESETQIFLQAEGGQPVSITILRRPGQEPGWSVALSEIVDDASAAPRPNSLLWYRLACTLPTNLPPRAFEEADTGAAAAIRTDYRVVLQGLGPCVRNRRP